MFRKLACNNNVQMGSARTLFYVVHYATKSTQKEDRGVDFEKIGHQVMRRIRKEEVRLSEEEREMLTSGNEMSTNYCFREGLSRFLLGMSVHLSQDVVSCTMAHLLICQQGSRFTFSHDFKDLLVGQMLNHLKGDDPGYFVLKRRNRSDKENEAPILWPDYSINDYLYRPSILDAICFYEFGMEYEKGYFTFAQMKVLDSNNLPSLDNLNDCYHFEEGHPGRKYCYLKKAKKPFIPKIASPKDMICDLELLELKEEEEEEDDDDDDDEYDHDSISPVVLQMRDDYAKCALVLFYPFRDNELFCLSENDHSLWGKFQRVMKNEVHNDGDIRFWSEGKHILQNMQDRIQSTKTKVPADELESRTENRGKKVSEEANSNERGHYDSDGESEAESIGSFNDEFYGVDTSHENLECHNLNDLKNGQKMRTADVISTRLKTMNNSIFVSDSTDGLNSTELRDDSEEQRADNSFQNSGDSGDSMSFATLLAFVSGSTVGTSRHNYVLDEDAMDVEEPEHNGYAEQRQEEMDISMEQLRNIGLSSNFNAAEVPTMRGVAKRIFEEKGIQLDPIQYVAYKIICSSFLLILVNESWEKRLIMFSSTFADESDGGSASNQEAKDDIVKKLRCLGAKDQLLMFITGPAGSGKSTALEVAQHFCFEFCKTIGEHWDNTTFLFSAMTGAAASLFGGVTTHSAAFLNKKTMGSITPELMRKWKHVKVFIVDEISMASDPNMTKMNDVLNKIRRYITPMSPVITPSMVFGGFSIIFSGDFHQLPPVRVDSSKYLYNGTSLWENAINVAVVLKNSHRFKDDPEYGRMLLRIWQGELTEEDRLKINNRIVGLNGVKLPPITSDSDIAYSCPKNIDRNIIQTELFQKHIQNFPSVSSDELPPEHTIVIEAHISKAGKKKKNNSNSNSNNETPPSIPVNNVIRHRIYTRCGDADVLCDKKHIDPAIKFYTGAHCMVNDNDNIDEGRANGTMCRAVSVKMKRNGGLTWKNYDGKKVYTVNILDTEYIICENFPPTIEQQKLQKQILDLKDKLQSQEDTEELGNQIIEL